MSAAAAAPEPIRILFVEDIPDEADLSVAQLKRAGTPAPRAVPVIPEM